MHIQTSLVDSKTFLKEEEEDGEEEEGGERKEVEGRGRIGGRGKEQCSSQRTEIGLVAGMKLQLQGLKAARS